MITSFFLPYFELKSLPLTRANTAVPSISSQCIYSLCLDLLQPWCKCYSLCRVIDHGHYVSRFYQMQRISLCAGLPGLCIDPDFCHSCLQLSLSMCSFSPVCSQLQEPIYTSCRGVLTSIIY